MKEYVYWRIRHDVYGEIDPSTKWFNIQTKLTCPVSMKQMKACHEANISTDFSPAVLQVHFANKETALADLADIRKYKTKEEQKRYHLVKVTVRRKSNG